MGYVQHGYHHPYPDEDRDDDADVRLKVDRGGEQHDGKDHGQQNDESVAGEVTH